MKIISKMELDNQTYFAVIKVLHDFGIYFNLLDLGGNLNSSKVKESVAKLSVNEKTEVRTRLAELGLKPCFQCGSILDFDGFNKSSNQNDGYATECSTCNAKRCSSHRQVKNVKQKLEAKYQYFSKEQWVQLLWCIDNINESVAMLNSLMERDGE